MTSDPFSPEPMACSSVGGCSQLSVEAFSRSVAERLLLRFTDTQWSGTCVIYKINSSCHALDIQYNRKWEPLRECEINLYTLTLCMTENLQLYGKFLHWPAEPGSSSSAYSATHTVRVLGFNTLTLGWQRHPILFDHPTKPYSICNILLVL